MSSIVFKPTYTSGAVSSLNVVTEEGGTELQGEQNVTTDTRKITQVRTSYTTEQEGYSGAGVKFEGKKNQITLIDI